MIFLLEDDDSIRKLIDYTLNSQGFKCLSFSLPSEFYHELSKTKPELILLDIMLPEEDGISILHKIRASPETSLIPVIMLTAKDSEFDVVTGLDSGADDYITKPFGMMTLLSRIKAVIRRYEKSDFNGEQKILEIDGLKVDLNKHTVFADGKQIFLTVKEFDLLVLLMKNRGNVLTREKLLDVIWKIDADIESRTVDVHIRTLRQKIGRYENLIETVRGVGYKCL
ncbi:MAG: response regulator transcription factor [Spirochaetia bacterium]|nr:response regulator transcription factor [Spirochaetia bacterium]